MVMMALITTIMTSPIVEYIYPPDLRAVASIDALRVSKSHHTTSHPYVDCLLACLVAWMVGWITPHTHTSIACLVAWWPGWWGGSPAAASLTRAFGERTD